MAEAGINLSSAIILFKSESTSGTDASPTVGSNALLVYNFSFNAGGNAESLPRKPYVGDSFAGNQLSVPGKCHGTFEFEFHVAGTGSVSDESAQTPGFNDVMLAAGMQKTYDASAGTITYDDIATATSGSMYVYEGPALSSNTADWLLMKSFGCIVEGMEFSLSPAGPLVCKVTGKGTTEDITDASDPGDPTVVDIMPPTLESLSHSFNFGTSYTPVFREGTLSMNNSAPMRQDIGGTRGYKGALFTNRDPKFNCTIEKDLMANFNPQSLRDAGTAGTFTTGTVGSTAGNRFSLTLNRLGIDQYQSGDADQIATWDLEMTVAKSVGALSTGAMSLVLS